MKRFNCLAVALLATAINSTGHAAPESAGDFSLVDQNGGTHQLSRYRHKEALVLVAQSNICPISPFASSQLQSLRRIWENQNVAFLMINGAGDDATAIQVKAKAHRMDIPILVDSSQMVTQTLKLSKSGEFVVLDPEDFSILYRGPFDSKFETTLSNVVAGIEQDTVVVPATGCDLNT